jgi:truncated hemoglobin YjbI
MELTLEQQLEMRKMSDLIKDASRDQLADLLLEAYRQMFMQQNHIKEILATQWGIER